MIDPRDFGLDNLPFGIVSDARDGRKRAAVAFEDTVIDLDCLVHDGVLDAESLLGAASLNDFLGEGLAKWRDVRARLRHLLGDDALARRRYRNLCYINSESRPRCHHPHITARRAERKRRE